MPQYPPVIFFDLDDTLLDYKRSERLGALQLRKEYRLEKWSPEEFLQKWEALLNEHIASYFAGLITFQEHRRLRIRAIFENPSISDTEADAIFATYSKTYEASWELFADTIPCFNAPSGVSLGVISNGNAEQQRRKRRVTGIDQHFETVVLSSEVGIAKPYPEIFHEACRQMKAAPGECVMVGDNWEWDILGAREAGMRAIWLCRNGKSPSYQDGIASLHELPTRLAG